MAKGGRFQALVGPLLGLALTLVGGCGDRAGDPVVPLEPGPELRLDPSPNQGGNGGTEMLHLPGGLCTSCDRGEDCGDQNDLCVINDDTDAQFCARHCDQGQDCPPGYKCVGVARADNQCVPDTDECDHVVTELAPSLATMRDEALRQLNELRAQAQLPPLMPTDCLNDIAHASALELARTGNLQGMFERDCEPIQPDDCVCLWNAETERSIAEYALTWREAIEDSILGRWGDDPNDSLVRNVTLEQHVFVGFGIVFSGDQAWTAISFGR